MLGDGFLFKKFVDNSQQCFAFTPQANFPTHNLNFQGEGDGDGIESRLLFKIFSTLNKPHWTLDGILKKKSIAQFSYKDLLRKM